MGLFNLSLRVPFPCSAIPGSAFNWLCVLPSKSKFKSDLRTMAEARMVVFGDADVAAGVERNELSLLGKVIGPSPSIRQLLITLSGLWNCSGPISVLPAAEDLIQVVFPTSSDMNRVLRMAPWILPKYLVNLAPWVAVSADVAEQLWRVPHFLQFWGVLVPCCSKRMATLLGGYLGKQTRERFTVRKRRPRFTYGRGCGWTPVSPFRHPSRQPMRSQFCYLCAVLGHIGQQCPRREELSGKSSPYSRQLISKKFGPKVNERNLLGRRNFTWVRTRASPSPLQVQPRPLPLLQAPDRLQVQIPDTSVPTAGGYGGPNQARGRAAESDLLQEQNDLKKQRLEGKYPVIASTSDEVVEATSPDWSHGDR